MFAGTLRSPRPHRTHRLRWATPAPHLPRSDVAAAVAAAVAAWHAEPRVDVDLTEASPTHPRWDEPEEVVAISASSLLDPDLA